MKIKDKNKILLIFFLFILVSINFTEAKEIRIISNTLLTTNTSTTIATGADEDDFD